MKSFLVENDKPKYFQLCGWKYWKDKKDALYCIRSMQSLRRLHGANSMVL